MKPAILAALALAAACLPSAPAFPAAALPDAPTAFAPSVPPPIPARGPETLKLVFAVSEKDVVIDPTPSRATTFHAWTFDGAVPGPFVRARVGDTLEFHLVNPASSRMAHNVDFHAVNGPGGGSVVTLTPPGRERAARFKLLNPGLYVSHCAAPPVSWHIAHGMYGLMYVQPRTPLPPADREFYVMEGEYYTKRPFGTPGMQLFDPKAVARERPSYVVFNGSVGSMDEQHPLEARVGDRVRLFFGNAGPNLVSSLHVLGAVFDRVWDDGATNAPMENVGVVAVPAAGTAIADFTPREPGNYYIVDHSMARMDKGAVAVLHVTGKGDPSIYEALTGTASD